MLKLPCSLMLLLSCFVSLIAAADDEPPRPNIVLIFVDDLGYGDLGCYGNERINTPNIDRLAAGGQRWTSFYASGSTCVPSRTGLMSGRHPGLLRGEPLKNDRDALFPAMLKRNGYATGMLGKWHLAGYPEDFAAAPMHPLNCGFDQHFGTPGSNDAPGPPKQTREAFDNATPFTWKIPLYEGRTLFEFPAQQQLFTRRYTERAVAFIDEARDQPFFLYVAHNMPHAPVFASEAFTGKSQGGRFGDVVEEIDWSVGQIVGAVERKGIAENTLIVFTSDNGPWSVFGPHAGTAKPLRGEKATAWEGGFRVPGIFAWSDVIEPRQVDGIGANLDLYATFASLVGEQALPSDKPGWMSVDLTPALLEGAASPRTSWFYGPAAYRSGNYKLHRIIRPPTDPITRKRQRSEILKEPLLFDLSKDIGEQHDISSTHPEIVRQMLAESDGHQAGSRAE